MFGLLLIVLTTTTVYVQGCRDAPGVACQTYDQSRLCRHPLYIRLTMKSCAATCGFCKPTSNSCTDTPGVQCRSYVTFNYCGNQIYKDFLLKNCKKSCNFCTIKPTNPPKPGTNKPSTGKPMTGSCGVPQIGSSRVIAGTKAKAGSWPWQTLMKYNGRAGCGGSLINSQWVVTAAHCVDGKEYTPSAFTLVFGENDRTRAEGTEQSIRAKKIISHSKFSMQTFDYDIALVKLERPVTMSKYILPVCLPAYRKHVPTGTQCYLTGFGKTSSFSQMSQTLQQTTLPIEDSRRCNQYNQQRNPGGFPSITKNIVCAGDGGRTRRNGCQGDSGGPLVCRTGSNGAFELHGVVSFGSRKCSSSETYSMFARVSELRNWMNQIMNSN